jgi:hypothetical protein
MIYIAHRGNIDGPSFNENQIDYIEEALEEGFDCEIDLRKINNDLYLGHNVPEHKVSIQWLKERSEHLWIHCKNLDALTFLLERPEFNCFYHDRDDFTLTSHNYIWTYPGKPASSFSIVCLPEIISFDHVQNAHGICSDYVGVYRK